MLHKQWPEENFFSQMEISSILRRFSIGKLTELMPQHRETHAEAPRIQRKHHLAWICWGVSYDATTKLHFCEKGLKTSPKVYENTLLEPVVKLFNNNLFSNEHWSFKQDLAPACKANSTKVWIWGIFLTLYSG